MDPSRKKKWTDKQVLEADPRTMDAGECSAMLQARGVDVPEGRVRRAQLVELVSQLQDSIRGAQGAAVTPSAETRKRSNSTRKKTATKAARSKAGAEAEGDNDGEAAEATPVRPKRKSGTAATKKAAEGAAEGEAKKRRSSTKAGTKRRSSAAPVKRTAKQEVKDEEEEEESEEETVAEPPKKTRQSVGARSKKHVAVAEKAQEESDKEEDEEEESEHEMPPKKKSKRSSSVSSKTKRVKKHVQEEEEEEEEMTKEKDDGAEEEQEADETEFIRKRSPRKSLENRNRELERTATVLGAVAAPQKTTVADDREAHDDEESSEKPVVTEPETVRVRRPSFLQRLFGGKPSTPAPAPAPAPEPEKTPETAEETTPEEEEPEATEEKETEVEEQKPSEESEKIAEEQKDEPAVERAPRLSFFKKIFAAKPVTNETTEAVAEEQKAPEVSQEAVANEAVPAVAAAPVAAEPVETHEQPRVKRSLRLSFFQKFFVHKTPETTVEPTEAPAPAPAPVQEKKAELTEPLLFKEAETVVARDSQSPRKSLRAQAAEREAAKREGIAAAKAAEQELADEDEFDGDEEEGVQEEEMIVTSKRDFILFLLAAVLFLVFVGAALWFGAAKPSGGECGDGMMQKGNKCVYTPGFLAELKELNQVLVRYLGNVNKLNKGLKADSSEERHSALLDELFHGFLGGFREDECYEMDDRRVSLSWRNVENVLERVAPYTPNTLLHGHTLREALQIAMDDLHRCPALHIDPINHTIFVDGEGDALFPGGDPRGVWGVLRVPLAVLAVLAAVAAAVYLAWRYCQSLPTAAGLVDSAHTILKDQAAAALAQAAAVSDADISGDHAAVMPAYLTASELRTQLAETLPADLRTNPVMRLRLWWAIHTTRNNSAVRTESTDIQGVPQETFKWIGAINM